MLRSITSSSFRIARTSLVANKQIAASATTQFQYSFRAFSDEITKQNGHCKWFDTKKGFGFIIPEDGSSDVFVHQSAIHADGFRSLAEGEALEFEILEEDNGKRSAQSVTGPNGAFVQGAPRRSNYDNDYNVDPY